MTCLLHRTGAQSWPEFLRGLDEEDESSTKHASSSVRADRLFQTLLAEVVTGSPHGGGVRQMQIPATVDCGRLSQVIRREFRRSTDDDSDAAVRRDVAFRALRELHKKIAYAASLAPSLAEPQAAAQPHVHALPLQPASAYLRPGAYLLAHPLLTGYFRRTVICLLDHVPEDDEDDDATPIRKSYGTYGLIVNRVSYSIRQRKHSSSGESSGTDDDLLPLTLPDILKPVALPDDLLRAFGGAAVREGGPVHFSLQMLHAATSSQQEQLGGCILPTVQLPEDAAADAAGDPPAAPPTSTAVDTDQAVYYRGNLPQVAAAVAAGELDRDRDVALFVGCSVWTPGQLQAEVERGCWLPCVGPAKLALTGGCDETATAAADETETQQQHRPQADLWLSMMAALGEDERQLAHALFREDGSSEHGAPCDQTDR